MAPYDSGDGRGRSWERVILGVVVAVCGLVGGGCFGYVPSTVPSMAAGDEVRVHLTRQGLADLADEDVPQGEGALFVGRFLGVEQDRLHMRVPLRPPLTASSTMLDAASSVGRNVTVPLDGIERVEHREFQRVRTILVVAGSVGAALALLLSVGDDGPPGGMPIPPGPPESAIRIPFPPS